MAEYRILVSDPLAPEGLEVLRREAEVDVRAGIAPEDLLAIIGEYDGLVVRSETKVTAEVLRAGAKLRVVGRAGVGVDNIDVPVATTQGVSVVNSPSGNTMAATEMTLGLMLALVRNIPQGHESLKKGEWDRKRFMGAELYGKSLGVIGFGRIGRAVARRAQAFDMTVMAYDPFLPPDAGAGLGVPLLPLDQLLPRAQFLTLHASLTPETRGLIGAHALNLLPDGARLINVARGGLIDENAVIAALDSGKLAGAALDVFAEEPPKNRALVEHPKVIVTPHLGASTREAQLRVAMETVEQVLAVLRGEHVPMAVNARELAAR